MVREREKRRTEERKKGRRDGGRERGREEENRREREKKNKKEKLICLDNPRRQAPMCNPSDMMWDSPLYAVISIG